MDDQRTLAANLQLGLFYHSSRLVPIRVGHEGAWPDLLDCMLSVLFLHLMGVDIACMANGQAALMYEAGRFSGALMNNARGHV